MSKFGWDRSQWAGFMPNGLGQIKPNHYAEIAKTIWRNRNQIPYAWRILSRGVCDGCALGTAGLRDFTMDGVHLCTVRLDLLRLNTMPALDTRRLEDAAGLKHRNAAHLRALGRLPYPMIRHRGEAGFSQVSWNEALAVAAHPIRHADPRRIAFYLTSRGLTNEVYYVAQKAARFLGTNNVDNASRVCHAPSTTALKQSLGVSASTCSYSDWIGTDLLVFFGSDVPNNQPVTTKYIYYAKKKGAKVVVVNPYREPGLERYWVPSVLESALFGTRIADAFFQIHTGGDIAFIYGVLKHLLENDRLDRQFVENRTTGFGELRERIDGLTWEELEASSGVRRNEMSEFSSMLAEARTGVFVWSMGITQHRFGVQNVRAIVNLALARGLVGREKCGLMPIRGHSGVQGGAEMGAVPWQFPGGEALSPASAARLEKSWGFSVPDWRGLSAVEMLDAAHAGELDVLYSLGGNFVETLPEPAYVREAVERVPVRIHQDIIVTPQMLLEPADTVVLLPASTRYEQRDGGTETSTERRILFSPEIPGRRIGEARTEWEILMLLAQQVYPERASQIHFDNGWQIREEIARVIPSYDGIQTLRRTGDAVQWGGGRLCDGGRFPTPSGKASFAALELPEQSIPEGRFFLSTRRGKQFNSMVHGEVDPLTGAGRDSVLMSRRDASDLALDDGDPVLLRSEVGTFQGRCYIGAIKERNVQVFWPEGNVLLRRGSVDPLCGIPDYNTVVDLIPAGRE